jgi:plasmid stability protein
LFEEALCLSQELGNPLGAALELKNLGLVAVALGDYPTARHYLRQALSTAHDRRFLGRAIDCLVTTALLFAAEGRAERALDLVGVTIPRLAVDKHIRDETRLRVQLETEFGPEAVAAAIDHGKECDLFKVARAVLAELEQE